MKNLEFRNRIKLNQQREAARRELSFWVFQAQECYGYLEIGDNEGLRENCLHAVRHILSKIKALSKKFGLNIPRVCFSWYI